MPAFKLIIFIFVFGCLPLQAAENSSELLLEADQLRSSDPVQFMRLLNQIEPDSLSASDYALYQYLSAYQLSVQGKFDQALSQLHDLSNTNVNGDLKIRIYASMLNINLMLSSWESGLKLINQLGGQGISHASQERKDHLNLTIVMFYHGLGDYTSALQVLDSAFSHKLDPRTECIANSERLRSLTKLGRHEATLERFPAVYENCGRINENIFKGIAVLIKAESLVATEHSDVALALLESELEAAQSTQYPVIISTYYAEIADIYLQQGDMDNAKQNALKAIGYADKIRNSEQLITAYKVLYEVSAAQGDYQQALDYHIQYTGENQSYWNDKKTKQFAIQRAKHDAMSQQQEITLLNSENTLLKIQSELDKQRAENNRLALAIVVLALFLIMLWTYRHKRTASKLKGIVEKDTLTGIATRYHFNNVASNILKRCEKNHQPVACVLFDLDNFKRVNDSYGHPVGDWAIRETVKAAVGACRSNDIIGRLGGEEFAILLPNCNNEQAKAVAEKCRVAIEAIDTAPTGHHFSMSASFGVTDTERCQYNMEKLYAYADAALYCSKDRGRNRVFLFRTEMLRQEAVQVP